MNKRVFVSPLFAAHAGSCWWAASMTPTGLIKYLEIIRWQLSAIWWGPEGEQLLCILTTGETREWINSEEATGRRRRRRRAVRVSAPFYQVVYLPRLLGCARHTKVNVLRDYLKPHVPPMFPCISLFHLNIERWSCLHSCGPPWNLFTDHHGTFLYACIKQRETYTFDPDWFCYV